MRFVVLLSSLLSLCLTVSSGPNELELKLDKAKTEATHACYAIAQLASIGAAARDELERLIASRLDHCYRWMDSTIQKRYQQIQLTTQLRRCRLGDQQEFLMEKLCPHVTTGILNDFVKLINTHLKSEHLVRRRQFHQNINTLLSQHERCKQHKWQKSEHFEAHYWTILDGSKICTWPQVAVLHNLHQNRNQDAQVELRQLTQFLLNRCLHKLSLSLYEQSIPVIWSKGQFLFVSELVRFLEGQQRDASELSSNILDQLNARSLFQNRLELAIFFPTKLSSSYEQSGMSSAQMYATGEQICSQAFKLNYYAEERAHNLSEIMAIIQSILSIDDLQMSRKQVDVDNTLKYVYLWIICQDIKLYQISVV